jgi:hypothetical protein
VTKKFSAVLGVFLITIVLTSAARPAARQASAAAQLSSSVSGGSASTSALRTFESALTPYFQARANRSMLSAVFYAPSQQDLFMIARHWVHFSPSFQALFMSAMQIPKGLQVHHSPGGHFDILYADSGADSVDITDTIGYSGTDWRTRTHAGNGIPDYVDEVAFAADSAWSMEVDRFGFVQPYPYVDSNYPSSRYKIRIRKFDGTSEDSFYALTSPFSSPSTGGVGQRSLIEIRSEWTNPSIWPPDYILHPEKPIRVTCAHEFFHTIQYAMAKTDVGNIWLDDFPVTWTEGSAVLMEDLCFDYINDYLQYLGGFFSNPTDPMLDKSYDGYTEYKNSIVLMYLYQFAAARPGIDFVKTMYDINSLKSLSFSDDLRKTALGFGRTWADLLGSFFTGSYYTGNRAVAGRFIADAPLLSQWSYGPDAASKAQPLTKSLEPFAMNTFSCIHQAGDADTLRIGFLGDSLDAGVSDTNAIWSVHCILKKNDRPTDDSVIALPVFSTRKAQASISGWGACIEALMIVTNARNDKPRNATVTFEACGTTVKNGETAVFSVDSNAPPSAQNAVVTVTARADLSCSMSLAKTLAGRQMLDSATAIGLSAAGIFYNLSVPLTWLYNASLLLAISEPVDSVRFPIDTGIVLDSLLMLYRWDNTHVQWQRCSATVGRSADSTLVFQSTVASPGIFGLFGHRVDTSGAIVAFPNPARLKSDGTIYFKGKNVLEIWIHAIDGSLLSHGAKGAGLDPSLLETKDGFSWRLQSNRGRAVSPGVYYASVGYKDSLTKGIKRKIQKVFVIP